MERERERKKRGEEGGRDFILVIYPIGTVGRRLPAHAAHTCFEMSLV